MSRSAETLETVVIGAGVVGTAAALELARRGHRVVVLEQFELGHERGSSHGPTRIFRLSYKDPTYVELARQSLIDWQRLDRDSGETLIEFTGGIDIGPAAVEVAESLERCEVEFEHLDPDAAKERFGLRIPAGTPIVFQSSYGVIAAQRTVELQTDLARRAGAQFRYGIRVERVARDDSDGVVLALSNGDTAIASRVILAAGPWTERLAESVGFEVPLAVTRQQVAYFSNSFPALPIVIDWREEPRFLLPPRHGADGVRAGFHALGPVVDPEDGPFAPDPAEAAKLREWLEDLTGVSHETLGLEPCLYTNAPGEDFILQKQGPVTLVSACSGHGFKFAPRIGRAAVDIALGKDPELPGPLGDWWRAA